MGIRPKLEPNQHFHGLLGRVSPARLRRGLSSLAEPRPLPDSDRKAAQRGGDPVRRKDCEQGKCAFLLTKRLGPQGGPAAGTTPSDGEAKTRSAGAAAGRLRGMRREAALEPLLPVVTWSGARKCGVTVEPFYSLVSQN